MRTIRVKVYKFSELSEASKQNAISNYQNSEIDTSYIYDDAYNTVKAFNELFGTKEGRESWLEVYTDHINDDILELKGLRLQKYIWNNFNYKLFKGKFFGSLKSDNIFYHSRIRSKQLNNGKVFNPYYSGITKETSCVLTGVCYDDDLLKPIYDFLELRIFDSTNFADLINECFDSLKKSIESEVDYINTDESIIENIEANDYEFLKDGTQF